MRSLELEAPAKINLDLRILGRRDDGFHEIRTRLAPLGLGDSVRLDARAGEDVALDCDDSTIPCDEGNLAVRAARAFFGLWGRSAGLRITLRKRIPVGAGLGGGSSDAAAVLVGANRLFGTGFSTAELADAGARLGSDVPFFVHGGVCDASGRGERVSPVPDFAWPRSILLLKPPFAVETVLAYRRWAGSVPLPGIEYGSQPVAWGELVNDLERPVFEKFPVLARLKTWLRAQHGVEAALMTGSGSTVFAVGAPGTCWKDLVGAARERFGTLFAADTAVRTGEKPRFEGL